MNKRECRNFYSNITKTKDDKDSSVDSITTWKLSLDTKKRPTKKSKRVKEINCRQNGFTFNHTRQIKSIKRTHSKYREELGYYTTEDN